MKMKMKCQLLLAMQTLLLVVKPSCAFSLPWKKIVRRAIAPLHSATTNIDEEQQQQQKATIEVERKYQYDGSSDSLYDLIVNQNGGSLIKELQFTDSYYDVPDTYPLCSKDRWLRLREQQWELKLPVDGAQKSGGETSIFTEIEGENNVRKELCDLKLIQDGGRNNGLDFNDELEKAGIVPFATFSTSRAKFNMQIPPSDGDDGSEGATINIDADVASFGHSVVELEIMCTRSEEVTKAEEIIEKCATKLGLVPCNTKTGGKLETYIRTKCPGLLEVLLDCGVLTNRQ